MTLPGPNRAVNTKKRIGKKETKNYKIKASNELTVVGDGRVCSGREHEARSPGKPSFAAMRDSY